MNWFAVIAIVFGVQAVSGQNCAHLLDVVAVVDGSDSILDDEFILLKNSLIQLTNWLDLGEEGQMFGAVVFSSSVSDVAHLSTNRSQLQAQISQFDHPQEGTHTHLGIAKMTEIMRNESRPGVPKVGIVITDGRSRYPNRTAQEAADAKALGIEMFAIGIGSKIRISELNDIASSNANVKNITAFSELNDIIVTLVQEVCKVDGNWTEWTDTVGGCSVSCGGGSKTISRTRACTNPAPSNGGADCEGSPSDQYTESCSTNGCPVDGNWTEWTVTTGDCSASCGGGSRTISRTRSCTNPAPSNGGADCVGSTTGDYFETCNAAGCQDPCRGCRYANGIGYLPDPDDCARFIQCQEPRPGTSAIFHNMQCSPGLYWNQQHLVCDWPANVVCTVEAADETFAPPTAAPSTSAPSSLCDGSTKAKSGNTAQYQQLIHGNWITRYCAPGTVYSSTSCICITGQNDASPVCQAEVYLPFNGDVNDHSANNYYVQNTGIVTTSRGHGVFSNNTQLRILRFSNMHFGNTLIISFSFKQTQTTSKTQAIVTNDDCGHGGSIYITTQGSTVYFRVDNSNNVMHTLNITYTATTSLIEVKLIIKNGLMKAEVNTSSKQMAFDGNIGKSQCAMQIGYGTGLDFFHGVLEEFKVFICDP
ncbi:protein PIF-like [Haliotis cracherodii]|uniref:protein PIF-like n=1 Tax=Haliotis cracherodii TaxID=6455 RepID=UPI0039E828F5